MAQGNKYQKFSEIDYCIRQYFNKYMASTISQEQAKLKDGQTIDYMMEQCKKRWNKDGKLNHDTKTFVNAFHRNLVALYGSKQSAQLLAYAKAYVNSRYESLTVEHLARKKVPQSSAQVRKSVDGPPVMLTEDHHHTVHEERQVCYSSHLRPKPLHL